MFWVEAHCEYNLSVAYEAADGAGALVGCECDDPPGPDSCRFTALHDTSFECAHAARIDIINNKYPKPDLLPRP